ncbi:hypothetical protein GCM10008910_08070 [Faecalicatena orotica]|uniref:Lipoprotein n=1 Tax=Faecalicatena orotica TaxID=1544 RepID=A0A2Y9C651_9FIRM|nr:hypothetical protein [Faecalicatena orotica]PWJ23591.1 hypothetical protein A8806_11324 [Faecalicatena orotica]SSA57503.1 hypothetical protein SAMN05216536_11324 [Faecalicatena orotica]
MMNRKKCVIYLTAAVMLFCAGCGSQKEKQTDAGDKKEASQPAETGNQDESKTKPEKDADTLSKANDIAAIYRFELDGHTYQLPFPVSELEENGWTLREGDAGQTMEGMSYVITSMTDANGNSVRLNVVNLTDQEQQLKDCEIGGIMIYAKGASNVRFQTADGISLSSTPEDIKKTYGTDEPVFSESTSQDDTTTIWYKFYKGQTDDLRMPSVDSIQSDEDTLSFIVDKNQKLTGIELQYFGSTQ